MLRLLPRVEAELGEAIEWYEARRAGLGAELLEAAARAFVRIQEAPHQLARWRAGALEDASTAGSCSGASPTSCCSRSTIPKSSSSRSRTGVANQATS